VEVHHSVPTRIYAFDGLETALCVVWRAHLAQPRRPVFVRQHGGRPFREAPSPQIAQARATCAHALQIVTFMVLEWGGGQIYDTAFKNKATEWRIGPPGANRNIIGMKSHRTP